MAEFSAHKTNTPGEWSYRGYRLRNVYKLFLSGDYGLDEYGFEINNKGNHWEISEKYGDFPVGDLYQEDLFKSKEACMSQIDKLYIEEEKAHSLKRKKEAVGKMQYDAFLKLKKTINEALKAYENEITEF